MANQTRLKLLNEAYSLMCTNGYSSFSYADLAKKIGISKASIHHHFPTKENLGEEVICAAYEETHQKLQAISLNFTSLMSRLEQYMHLFSQHSELSQIPLCCSLSSEFPLLPDTIQIRTQEYFQLQINWLKTILQTAQDNDEIKADANINDLALTIIKLFEGTSIVGRVLPQQDIFQKSLRQIEFLIGS